MNRRRDAAQFRGQEYRSRGVAADAEDDVRSMLADDRERLAETDREPEEALDRVADPLPFQSADGDQLERKAGFRDDDLLEAALRADENDAPLRIARDPLLRNGDCGVDVPPRPAPGDHQRLPHTLHAHRSDFPQPDCCDKFNKTPTAMRLVI